MWVQTVQNRIQELCSAQCYHFFLAVSGGVDSMTLLDLFDLPEVHPHLTVLHFNHCLRGRESDADEAFVLSECNRRNLEILVGRGNVSEQAKAQKASLELVARKMRYDFFKKAMEQRIRGERFLPVLVLAHQREDQTETILMHLFRGSGMPGLIGMQEWEARKDFFLFRPLLRVSKEKIYQRALERSLPWREDSSNLENSFSRNFLRLEILPQLRGRYPSLDDSFAKLSEILDAENQYLNERTKEAMERVAVFHPCVLSENPLIRNAALLHGVAFRRKEFLNEPIALRRRILYSFCLQNQANSISMEEIEKIHGLFTLPKGKWIRICDIIFLCDFQGVIAFIAKERDEKTRTESVEIPSDFCFAQKGAEESGHIIQKDITWANGGIRISPVQQDSDWKATGSFCYVNAEGLSHLLIRPGRSGEIFQKFGGGSKALRLLYNEWKLPSVLRARFPVICDEQGILWVPGMGRSARRKATDPKKTLKIEWRWK